MIVYDVLHGSPMASAGLSMAPQSLPHLVIPFTRDRHDGIRHLTAAPPRLDTHAKFARKRLLPWAGRILAPAGSFLHHVEDLGIARCITRNPKAKLLAQAIHQSRIDALVTLAYLQAIGALLIGADAQHAVGEADHPVAFRSLHPVQA